MGAKQIATDIGVSRNAVYQHIERLRRQGALAETYTPSGQPPRRLETGRGVAPPAQPPPRESALARLRELAAAGTPATRATRTLIEGAIAAGDAVGLAYELGRLDARGDARAARGSGRVGPAPALGAAARRRGAPK